MTGDSVNAAPGAQNRGHRHGGIAGTDTATQAADIVLTDNLATIVTAAEDAMKRGLRPILIMGDHPKTATVVTAELSVTAHARAVRGILRICF